MTVKARNRADALEAVGTGFKSAVAAVRRMRGRETHRAGELSHAQYGLLFGLYDGGAGGAKSSRELAHAADVSPATAAEMLDGLAAAGLVERVRSPEDKRIVLTSLTPRDLVDATRKRRPVAPRLWASRSRAKTAPSESGRPTSAPARAPSMAA